MREGLIYTNENCIGCNKCVRICSSFGASVSKSGPDNSSIRINSERCIVCGACVDVCSHGARQYHDDTDAFMTDLQAGVPISVLVAPAFAAKYPRTYRRMLGSLRKRGVRRVIPVSLGADICTWAYLKCLDESDESAMVSTSCPVVVSYVEHWRPELIPRLLPIKSPLMCIATYCREQLGMTERFAFIGPCIAKRLEMDRFPDLVQYNVTFPRLEERLGNDTEAPESDFDDMVYGLGSYYPAPGGLADNVRWLVGEGIPIRSVSGKRYLYERFERGGRGILSRYLPNTLVDALNCQEGCIEGTARIQGEREEIGLARIHEIRLESMSRSEDSPWNPNLPPIERLKRLNEQFADLDIESYRVEFVDQSDACGVEMPTREQEEKIFTSMHKLDAESRQVNCSACGYETCREMMIAIHNGFNTRYNCVYFEKEEAIRLARMSYTDQLTDVMNRNALEMTGADLYGRGHSIGLIVADVDGLKQLNDTKGHGAGDALIRMTATALANQFGRERVFRTGGDEFMVILQDHTFDEVADGIAAVKKHLAAKGASASMGMSYEESYEDNFDMLEKLADARMYEDKARYYEKSGLKRRI